MEVYILAWKKFRLYFGFYDHKLWKVNLINVIVCKKDSFKGDIRQKQKICYFMTVLWPIKGGHGVHMTGYIDSPYMESILKL